MIDRILKKRMQPIIDSGISILLLGPRQTGKTTFSSARKLKRKEINLLPGRIVTFRMDALFWEEYGHRLSIRGQETIKAILKFGELPRIFELVSEGKNEIAIELLYTYVTAYLEEEVRAEALVRNIGAYSRFLKLAAEESGKTISFRNFSQDIGVPHQKISEYYNILIDCLIAEKIEALVPAEFPSQYWGGLFEQWVGLTISKFIKINGIKANLYYWRDYSGREVDWIGGLKEFREQYTSLELQKKADEWRD